MTENDHHAVGMKKFVHQLDESKTAKTAPESVQTAAGIIVCFCIALEGKKRRYPQIVVTKVFEHYVIGCSAPGLACDFFPKSAVDRIGMGQRLILDFFYPRIAAGF